MTTMKGVAHSIARVCNHENSIDHITSYKHIYIHIYIQTHIHTYTYTYIHVYIHTYLLAALNILADISETATPTLYPSSGIYAGLGGKGVGPV